jgi:hypothetical protein
MQGRMPSMVAAGSDDGAGRHPVAPSNHRRLQEAVRGAQAAAVMDRDREHPGHLARERDGPASRGPNGSSRRHIEIDSPMSGPGLELERHRDGDGTGQRGRAQRSNKGKDRDDGAERNGIAGTWEPLSRVGYRVS